MIPWFEFLYCLSCISYIITFSFGTGQNGQINEDNQLKLKNHNFPIGLMYFEKL